jgi:hypothetical protein
MIEDGRAFGATMALKHILGLLERKGVITHGELTSVLDAALAELGGIDQLSPAARAEAGRAVGLLYVRP